MKTFFLILLFTLLTTLLNAKTIAKIPEASGICFIESSKSLVVVNDVGWIYELKTNGKILKKQYLGDYDLEGVTYDKSTNTLLLAIESKNNILIIDRTTFKIKKEIQIKKTYEGINLLKKSQKDGIEAISTQNGEIYLSNQSYKKWPKENASVVFKIDSLDNKKAKITKIYDHGYVDIAGLCFHNGYLYMTSDKKNLLIKYDLKNNKTIQKVKLPKSAQEGICFDEKNNIYIADDNGAILKYKAKDLGL